MSKHYGISTANLPALAEKMTDWRGRRGGVDRQGLYSISTTNPEGRWDWYEIGGRWDRYIKHSRNNAIKAKTLAASPSLKNCLPYFVLTPEGEWLQYERVFFVGEEQTPNSSNYQWTSGSPSFGAPWKSGPRTPSCAWTFIRDICDLKGESSAHDQSAE